MFRLSNPYFFLITWNIILLLLYIFLFSDAGYFAIQKKIHYKNFLQSEIDNLKKENQNLEEKLILNKIFKEDYKVLILKFNKSENQEENTEEKIPRNNPYLSLLLPYDSYFYFYIFIGILGNLLILISYLHTKSTKNS